MAAQQVNTDIIPASPGLRVGHDNQRWNGYFDHFYCNFINDVPCPPATGGGGGGGTIPPGTPFQVIRYDITGTTIQDSTGNDNPANGPTRWVNGLTVMSNGLGKQANNSANGTVLNLLVCADLSVSTTFQVTTCPVSTTKAFGVADNGAGTTGNVQVYDHGYHPCIFDNQTTINDYVVPSATVAGECNDVGGSRPTNLQILGKITSTNSGAGTLATVDWFTGDSLGAFASFTNLVDEVPGGTVDGANRVFTLSQIPNPTNSLKLYRNGVLQAVTFDYSLSGSTITFVVASTPLINDLLFASYTTGAVVASNAVTSVFGRTGGVVSQTGDYDISEIINGAKAQTCTNQLLSAIDITGAAGNCKTVTSSYVNNSIALTGVDINTSNQVTATHLSNPLPVAQGGTGVATAQGSGSKVQLSTGPTTNNDCVKFDASGNTVDAGAACGSGGGGGTTPTSCSTVSFSATPTFDSTGNAFCFKITLTGDVTSSTFANGVNGAIYTFIVIQDSTGGRKFTPPTQMKQYDYWMASPSNEVVQQFVYDGTNLNAVSPSSPDTRPFTAGSLDDEFDSNTFNTSLWTWVNQGTSTITEKQGAIFFVPQYAAGENVRFAYQANPATPWTAATKMNIIQTASAGNQIAGICASDGTKLECLSIDGSTNQLAVYKWTNATTFGSTAANWNVGTYLRSPWYLAIQDDGVNLNFNVSSDGIFYKQIFTEARLTYLASVSRIGIYMDTNNATNPSPVATYWWFRRTQ